jgi:hypothetical protein
MITPRSRAPLMTSSATRSGLGKIKRSDLHHLATPRVGCLRLLLRSPPGVTCHGCVTRCRTVTCHGAVTGHGGRLPWCMRATLHATTVSSVASVASHATRATAREKAWRTPEKRTLRSEICCEPGRPLSHLSHLSHPMRHVRHGCCPPIRLLRTQGTVGRSACSAGTA